MIDPDFNVGRIRRDDQRVDSKGRPRLDPQARKPFDSFLDDQEEDERKKKLQAESQEGPVSIFDISRQKAKQQVLGRASSGKEAEEKAEEGQVFLPKMALEKKLAKEGQEEVAGSNLEEGQLPANIHAREGKEEGQEKHDSKQTASVAPEESIENAVGLDIPLPRKDQVIMPDVPQPMPLVKGVEGEASFADSQSRTAQLQALIDKVVQSMLEIQKDGKSDLAVTLRYPPILDGAQLVLTSFSHAKGEFNVAFYNLTQASQQFLDQMHAQDALRREMELNACKMHRFDTTLQPFAPVIATNAENRSDPRQFRDQQEDGKGRQNPKKGQQNTA